MEKRTKPRFLNCIVVIVVGLFLCLPFLEKPKTVQYDIVFLGDSIIGNYTGDESVTGIVSETLGKSTFNGAFGGTTFSRSDELSWGSVTNIQWCMVNLAEAIAYNDWRSQMGAMEYADYYGKVNAQALYYFKDRMQELSQIDFAQAEVLVIEHGTNDYNCSRRLDNPEDLYDVTTFGGAMRYSLSIIQKAYPDLKIVILSPTYCEFGPNGEEKCYSQDWGQGTLDKYVVLEKEIAAEFGVGYIDAYNDSGIWEESAGKDLTDGLHLSQTGTIKLGNFVAERLSEFLAD